MHPSEHYDYIITGGGCAGLSLAMHILAEPKLHNKTILLIEQDDKNLNDRTWCYWERGSGFFEGVVYRSWQQAWFHSEGYSSIKSLSPYAYKMIRGIDFYQHCLEKLKSNPSVTLLQAAVEGIRNTTVGVEVDAGGRTHKASFAFNSILFEPPVLKASSYMLKQHFKGWIIEADEDIFQSETATLMDFRVSQQHGTTFVYVMPFSSRKALVEFTLFTKSLLADGEYDEGLKHYISDFLKGVGYKVLEEEWGVIPMTDHEFPLHIGNQINLGTAGGLTKPSSGYTFRFIQKHSEALVQSLVSTGKPFLKQSLLRKRFLWYDRVLLHMLFYNKMPGASIFRMLFSKNRIARIFRFLDNETTIAEELLLLNTLPQWPFMKAGWFELNKD